MVSPLVAAGRAMSKSDRVAEGRCAQMLGALGADSSSRLADKDRAAGRQ